MLNQSPGNCGHKKSPAVSPPGAFRENDEVLDDDDVFCLGAFLALSYVELNFLAFDQSLEA